MILENLVEARIIEWEIMILCSIPTSEEIKKVIFNMNPLKALGPGDLLGLFYKQYLPIVGNQIIEAVKSFFQDGWLRN